MDSWKNLLELWGNTEKILYIICNGADELPRDGIERYASPISNKVEEMLNSESVQFESVDDVKKFISKIQKGDRYSGINFMNVGQDKNTIEFRLANGTIDENTWIENINLFGGIINAAEKLTYIQNKPKEELTEEEKRRLQSFEELKNSELDDKERFEKLMIVAIKGENRKIYRGRFNTNSKLLEQNKKLERRITKSITKSGIDIKKVGKKVFTGEDSITGQDFEDISKDIEQKQHNKEKHQDENNSRDD